MIAKKKFRLDEFVHGKIFLVRSCDSFVNHIGLEIFHAKKCTDNLK